MSEVKQIAIRGDAVAAYTKERKTRKRKSQNGGYDVPSPAGAIPLTPANLGRVTNFVRKMAGGANATPTMLGGAPPTMLAAANATPTMLGGGALVQLASTSSVASPAPASSSLASPASATLPKLPQAGGAKPKLILEPKKKSMKKLHLAPASVSGSHGKRSVSKTRKIRVNLNGMKKRLTRAKEIHKESRHKDIDYIKKTLIDAKLIKPRDQSKPDSTEYDMMLRKTYENYMLLRNKAL
jgi:hypothetical protein